MRFRLGGLFGQRHAQNGGRVATLLLTLSRAGDQIRLENRYLGHRDDDLRVLARQNTIQNLLLAGPQPHRNYALIEVEDEIKFPEYIDVTEEAKDFILKICKKNP